MNFRLSFFAVACAALSIATLSSTQARSEEKAPLKVLLVAGGCCHDYATQSRILKSGIEERLNATVTVVYNPSKGTDARFEIYENKDWAKGYDVIIHDECSASVTDKPYVKRILDAHRDGVPAVNLHCAMHSYRWGDYGKPVAAGADNAGWFEMIGLQSTGHGPQQPIDVTYTDDKHPITRGLENWKTINEELYNNIQIFDGTVVLASGLQTIPVNPKDLQRNPDAKPREAKAVVAWVSEYGPKKTKIFSTTLGHNNDTVADPRYLDLVTRGILWATDNLSDDGTPTAGLKK